MKWPNIDYFLRWEELGEKKMSTLRTAGSSSDNEGNQVVAMSNRQEQFIHHMRRHETTEILQGETFSYFHLIGSAVRDGSHGHQAYNQALRDAADDYLKVNIFFADHQVEVITESEQFPSIFNFLSALGGSMSLWLGITIVGAFEVIEWLFRMCMAVCYCKCCKRIKHRYSPTSQVEDPHARPV